MLPLSTFLELSNQYYYIPIIEELCTIEQFKLDLQSLSDNNPYLLLLESGEHNKDTGRFTYFAQKPFLTLQVKNHQVNLEGNNELIRRLETYGYADKISHDPFAGLQSLLDYFQSPNIKDSPPFTGGCIGYFSYEFIKRIENIENTNQLPSNFSEFHLAFVNELLAFDHTRKKIFLIYNVAVDRGNKSFNEQLYYREKEQINQKISYWKNFIKKYNEKKIEINLTKNSSIKYQQLFQKEDFLRAVESIKENIQYGEIFQAVLSRKISLTTNVKPELVYQVLRMLNPSPYMFYLKMNKETLIGTSPETLVKVMNNEVETYPIAGTRPRGKDIEEEQKLMEDLLSDSKEIAEHVMLIDLARNDLGRVCQAKSVKVVEKMKLEKYSHVMHLVSKVTGKLKEGYKSLDALKAAFPAGTVSGAPKVRAMEIIADLEPEERGPYAGAVAGLGYNGNMDTCITIRSIFFEDNKAHIQAGAGIVADSVPEKEYLEVSNKSKVMLKAIELSETIRLNSKRLVELSGGEKK